MTTAYKLVRKEPDGRLLSLVPTPFDVVYPTRHRVRPQFGRLFCYLELTVAQEVFLVWEASSFNSTVELWEVEAQGVVLQKVQCDNRQFVRDWWLDLEARFYHTVVSSVKVYTCRSMTLLRRLKP
jgi:hypothetical protein